MSVLCPKCATEAAPSANICARCGRDLTSLRDANKYQLVRDGELFAISLRGRIILGRTDLKAAQKTLAIVNGEEFPST